LLVSAAAGSGKTAVLAERCARLVCEPDVADGGCGVDGLLVLTFTDAAANEMRGRIAEAIREKLRENTKHETRNTKLQHQRWLRRQAAMVDRASISTLHGFCSRVLRQHFHEAQIDPAFEVIDEDEARLMRDEVLTDLLARWHKVAREKDGELFAAFLEGYAQGRDATCRELILRVHRMLSSTADPAKYVADARGLYAKEGRQATVDRFVRMTIAGQLRLFSLTVRRAVERVRVGIGPGQMLTELQKAAGLVEWAQGELESKAAAIPVVREAFSYKWPTCKTIKEVANFESLKKRTWERVKEKMKSLCNDALATDAADLLEDLAGLGRPLDALLALVADFDARYTAAKRGQNRLDFSDLERLTLNLLTAPGSLAAAELRGRYCHLLVDEFQDINPLQATLLETLRSAERFGGAGNLFVVGDVKQSIYGFRLAEPALFLERERAARAAGGGAGARRYVGLPHNFRSQPNLLGAMNAFFERLLTVDVTGISYGEGHALRAPEGAKTTGGDPKLLSGSPVEMHLVVMTDDGDEDEDKDKDKDDEGAAALVENLSAVEEEARMVAERIASLMAEKRTITVKGGEVRGLKYRDIAILLRSMKDKAMIFARALARRGIPVHADLSTGYFDTAEVRDTLALLQVLDNPQQDIPLATAMLGPYGRFSHDDVARVRLAFSRKEVSFPDAVVRFAAEKHETRNTKHETDAELAARIRAFLEKLGVWRERLKTRPLHEGLAEIYAESKILPYLAGTAAGSQRVANLQALHQRALKFAGFRKQGLHRFLRFIEKLREQEGDFGEAPVLSEASDVVRIMSVHKSKGLEFPVVFASGLGGFLNLIDTGPVFVHRDLGIGLQVADVERNIFYHSAASKCITDSNEKTKRAEELRLLYVALTRARDHLILTGYVNKAEELAEARQAWAGHEGPLPEDVLLRGRTFLQWLLPALACCSVNTQWPGEELGADARVTITLHHAIGVAAAVDETAAQDEVVKKLVAAEPLAEKPVADAAVERLVQRVTGEYGHEELARQAAVMTVSELKHLAQEQGPEEMPAVRLAVAVSASGVEARARGIATHRVLELLDFANCSDAAGLASRISDLVSGGLLAAEEATIADVAGIEWFLFASEAGKRLRDAVIGGDVDVRREIPFAWAAPVKAGVSDDPADWPTIRGVIDVLLVDRSRGEAEIIDYKTDSAFTWEKNAEGYREQMRYYLKAASDILGFAVKRATLVFLTPREVREVAFKDFESSPR
jgi:ATP-dependent helicase/nuclease subunit A